MGSCIEPQTQRFPHGFVLPDEAQATLRGSGARVLAIHPADTTQDASASVGGNLLDPCERQTAARSGRLQGQWMANVRMQTLWN
jgi:hypothetical protein